MRKLTTLFVAVLFVISLSGQSQNCEAVKKENQNLKATISKLKQDTAFLNRKIALCDYFSKPKEFDLKSFSTNFNVEVLSCKGDRGQQTVKVEFLISHSLPHQELCINIEKDDAKAVDELGNMFTAKEGSIGAESTPFGYVCTTVPTDVPTKSYIVFRNILPSTDILKFLTVRYGYKNADGGYDYTRGFLEIRNLKIQW